MYVYIYKTVDMISELINGKTNFTILIKIIHLMIINVDNIVMYTWYNIN